jgi:hypothetical protein
MIAVVAQPRSRIERELLAEQYLTSENKDSSKKDGLQVLNKITETQHRALFISTISPSARSYLDFAYRYGPVPFPPCDEDFKVSFYFWEIFERKINLPKARNTRTMGFGTKKEKEKRKKFTKSICTCG